jgi:hypothetical protein
MFMDQKIFSMDLSVEATSAYILICTLVEGGAPVTIESAGSFWNGTPETLSQALAELSRHRIIDERLDANMVRQYHVNRSERWQFSQE